MVVSFGCLVPRFLARVRVSGVQSMALGHRAHVDSNVSCFCLQLYMPPTGYVNNCDGGRSHTYCDYRQQ
eukprot:2947593-Rhodomonas_salina.5